MTRALLAMLSLALLAAPALAEDSFEQKAATARTVENLDEVVWSLIAACDKGDEVQQRQCRQVRDARAKPLIGATLFVQADPEAFEISAFNAAKKSVSVQVSSCVRCAGMSVDGKPWHITGAAPRVEGEKLRTPWLYDTARPFPDEAAAKAWAQTVAGSRVQMVIKILDRKKWLVGGKDGLLVEVLAWRVITPCTGAVVIASPASANAAPDRKACPAPPAPPTK